MTFAIVPSQREDFVELASSASGKLYRKHILSAGPLRHPRTKRVLDISEDALHTMVRNFQNKVVGIVQVPIAGSRNEHTEDPTRNLGEVVGLEVTDGKLYSIIDARDEAHADKLGKTLLGASAMIDMDYEDARTGEKVGPALLHVCVTNRPYVTELEDYQELIAASADSVVDAVLLTADLEDTMPATENDAVEPVADEAAPVEAADEAAPVEAAEESPAPEAVEQEAEVVAEVADEVVAEETAADEIDDEPIAQVLSKDELIAALKEQFDIDVEALIAAQEEAEKEEATASLSSVLGAALLESNMLELSDSEEPTDALILSAVADMADQIVSLSREISTMKAEATVDELVACGRILPAQRDSYVELSMENPALFEKMVSETPLVELSREVGTSGSEEDRISRDEAILEKINAYTSPEGPAAQAGYIR